MAQEPHQTEPSSFTGPGSERMQQRLRDLRQALLRLHKALLEGERIGFERIHGRVSSSGEFLQLVANDPWFAWLHPLSEFVVRLDELLDWEASPAADIAGLFGQTRKLLTPSETGAGFANHYYHALQQHPDVVLAHAAVLQILR